MASIAWPKGSVKDVAESLGISNMTDEVALALAADVEYRLREIVEESLKFMRHSRRTRLKVDDIDYALKVRNIEPLWGFSSSHAPILYRKAPHPSGNLYYVDDEEIDLSRFSQSALPPLPREVSYTAHWLAVEGVQPAIPQNPSPADIRAATASSRSLGRTVAFGPEGTEVKPLVAHALSKELQLYFDRLTLAALDADETMRAAALESFRGDTGLQGLVAYLVQWVAERVVSSLNVSLSALDQCLDILEAMMHNPSLFIEPYLHQILPPVLSILLTSSLGPFNSATQFPGLSHITTRQHASAFLTFLLQRYGNAYTALKPRILQTVLRGLVNGCSAELRNTGTLVGSIMGIRALGKDSVRRTFGARSPNLSRVGEALQSDGFPISERELCSKSILEALQEAYPASAQHISFDYQKLEALTGTYFAEIINARCTADVPRGLLSGSPETFIDQSSNVDEASHKNMAGEPRHTVISAVSQGETNVKISIDTENTSPLAGEAEEEASNDPERDEPEAQDGEAEGEDDEEDDEYDEMEVVVS